MNRFTSPLDNIRVASPCSANWDEMYGNDRKRFCGDCNLSVYNLSGMSRQEAENLILSTEGRLCVRFFRRADGTILTKNCPVGWQAVKRRVSRVATAAFSMTAGFFGGLLSFGCFKTEPYRGDVEVGVMVTSGPDTVIGDVVATPVEHEAFTMGIPIVGSLVVEKPEKRTPRHSTRLRSTRR